LYPCLKTVRPNSLAVLDKSIEHGFALGIRFL